MCLAVAPRRLVARGPAQGNHPFTGNMRLLTTVTCRARLCAQVDDAGAGASFFMKSKNGKTKHVVLPRAPPPHVPQRLAATRLPPPLS